MLEENKPKSVIISRDIHNEFKNFCRGKNLKIGGVVENLMRYYIDNYSEITKLLEHSKSINYNEKV